MTTSPFWFISWKRKRTTPRSGLEAEGRASRISRRTDSTSPGKTGFSQRTSSMPGEPMEVEPFMKPSNIIRMRMAQECQPEAASPPSMEARPASSSRWKGCGSNWLAKSITSSLVTS